MTCNLPTIKFVTRHPDAHSYSVRAQGSYTPDNLYPLPIAIGSKNTCHASLLPAVYQDSALKEFNCHSLQSLSNTYSPAGWLLAKTAPAKTGQAHRAVSIRSALLPGRYAKFERSLPVRIILNFITKKSAT